MIDGRFEFLLQYLNGFNRLQQRNNPIKDFEEKAPAKDYTELKCTFRDNCWGGFVSSNSPQAFIDGSVSCNYYYYAMGTTSAQRF